ncbi:MAG: hypothetical protein FJ290_22270 [Planctomycetes bacterium]|nr:hypothetical protein [Planctomycetota bacterium]
MRARSVACVAAAVAFLGCVKSVPSKREEPAKGGVEKLDHRGWKECYKLWNASCEAIVAPAVGSRVVAFAYRGKNVLFEDKSLNGRVMTSSDYDDEGRYWMPWDGSQPDMFNEKGYRQFYPVWMGAYKVTKAEPLGITTECLPQKPQQGDAHCIKTFALDPRKPRLTFAYKMVNQGKDAKTWALLQRTLFAAPGLLLVPLKSKSAFEGGWKIVEPAGGEILTTSSGQRTLARIKEHIVVPVGDCLVVAPHMLGAKSKVFVFDSITLHTDSDAGWMAWIKDDVAFVMQYPYSAGGKRRVPNVVTQNWFTADRMELCPFSPLTEVKPGGSVSFDTVWTFVPLGRPVAEPKQAEGLRAVIEKAIRNP